MKKPTFDIPEGMELPPGVKEDVEFDALATVTVNKEGKMTLVALDGFTVAPDKDEDSDPSFADVVASKMPPRNTP